jgi:hypothetical protein
MDRIKIYKLSRDTGHNKDIVVPCLLAYWLCDTQQDVSGAESSIKGQRRCLSTFFHKITFDDQYALESVIIISTTRNNSIVVDL